MSASTDDDVLDHGSRRRFAGKVTVITGATGGIGQAVAVNVASTNALIGNSDIPLYHATKAAVSMLSRCDGVAYAHLGIRFNAVDPGCRRTAISHRAATISPDAESYLRDLVVRHPLGRQAERDEIAAAIPFLASDDTASWSVPN